jgi:small ubiquitin-related modifier
MQKVFIAYASAKGLNVDELRFCLDGQRIQPSDTPETLKLEDQDQIDCFLAQDGG